jgi:hypothetical protein
MGQKAPQPLFLTWPLSKLNLLPRLIPLNSFRHYLIDTEQVIHKWQKSTDTVIEIQKYFTRIQQKSKQNLRKRQERNANSDNLPN